MKSLVDLVYTPRASWNEDKVRTAFNEALTERFQRLKDLSTKRNDERRVQLRVNSKSDKDSVPYAALLPPDQEESGAYGGMSFVVFPADGEGPRWSGWWSGPAASRPTARGPTRAPREHHPEHQCAVVLSRWATLTTTAGLRPSVGVSQTG